MTHNRRNIRLKRCDCSKPGAYFITVCTQNRKCLSGDIINAVTVLNDYGNTTVESWKWLENRYKHVKPDEWIIFPNHIHGILWLTDTGGYTGVSRNAPTDQLKSPGSIVGAFKTYSSRQIDKLRNNPGKLVWPRNYYERVIRNEDELNKARENIVKNPKQWEIDKENPKYHTTG